VFDDFGGWRELPEVMADHFRDDGDRDEFPAVVDRKPRFDHFWENDQVTTMGPNDGFVVNVLGLDLPDFFEKANVTGRKAAKERSALTGRKETNELVHR